MAPRRAVMETEARLALTGLGFSQAEARAAVAAASERIHAPRPPGGTQDPPLLETLIREALREAKALRPSRVGTTRGG